MNLPDPYPLVPFSRPVDGAVTCPGSKSITNRALILAALTSRRVVLEGALFSRDTEIMITALQELGIPVVADPAQGRITVDGQGGAIPNPQARLDVGNSGTSARFLTAFLCLAPGGIFELVGDTAMYSRPMHGLLEALSTAGWATATSHGAPGHLPFTLKTHGIRGDRIEVDPAESSQMLSALLMVAPLAADDLEIRVPSTAFRQAYVRLTLAMLEQFGATPPRISATGDRFQFTPCPRPFDPPEVYPIEPDASAASYFLALPLATRGSVLVKGFPSRTGLQGDLGFIEVLEASGLRVDSETGGLRATFPAGAPAPRSSSRDFFEISDTFLTYAALCPFLEGPFTISGIEHTRRQETDRVAGAARNLQALLQGVEARSGSLRITPEPAALKRLAVRGDGVMIETFEDHRFAMSFALPGISPLFEITEPWLYIHNPTCSGKTFPNYFSVLESLRP